MVVVNLEAAIQTPARIQNERAHKGCRIVSVALEGLRQQSDTWEEVGTCVVAGPVVHRIGPAQDYGMRGESDGNLGQGVFKTRALRGQGIHGGGSDAVSSVASQTVPAQRIDGDQHNRCAVDRVCSVTLREAGGTTEQAQENGRPDPRALSEPRHRRGSQGHYKFVGRPALGLRLTVALTSRDSPLIRNFRFQLCFAQNHTPVASCVNLRSPSPRWASATLRGAIIPFWRFPTRTVI